MLQLIIIHYIIIMFMQLIMINYIGTEMAKKMCTGLGRKRRRNIVMLYCKQQSGLRACKVHKLFQFVLSNGLMMPMSSWQCVDINKDDNEMRVQECHGFHCSSSGYEISSADQIIYHFPSVKF